MKKLAAAYYADETASSMMAMRTGNVLTLSQSAFWKSVRHPLLSKFMHAYLKNAVKDPNDADANYAHIFHEKILSG
jgi:hypothetical protein